MFCFFRSVAYPTRFQNSPREDSCLSHCHESSSGIFKPCEKIIRCSANSEWIWLLCALEKLRTQSSSLLAHAILKHQQMTLWRLNRPTEPSSVETRMQNYLWNEHLVFQSRRSRSKSPHTWEIGDEWPEWHVKFLCSIWWKHQETNKNLRPLRSFCDLLWIRCTPSDDLSAPRSSNSSQPLYWSNACGNFTLNSKLRLPWSSPASS